MSKEKLEIPEDLKGWYETYPKEHPTHDLIERIARLETENAEYATIFDLRWKADMRAIKRWQEAHPGNDLVWPDQADMVTWMMGQLSTLKADRDALLEALTGIVDSIESSGGRDENGDVFDITDAIAAIKQAESH